MSEKRKDSKGRILRDGESQRNDGRYMYRYTDIGGKRSCIYATTLDELRKREKEIKHDLDDGINYSLGSITLIELSEMYISQKRSVRYTTMYQYSAVIALMKKYDFCYKKIKDIKPSMAKSFFASLHDEGYSYGMIVAVRNVVKPAFAMAVEDDIVRKNPFSFRLSGVVENDREKRASLTPDETSRLLSAAMSDSCCKKYYDEIVILLNTGLRISELYGLTMSDIDFDNRRIRVERQLRRKYSREYYVEKPKSKSGERLIPMSDAAYNAFVNVINNRATPPIEMIVDGHAGFLFLMRNGKPKTSYSLERELNRFVDRYNRTHDDKLPHVTPHVLRHTFCTNMVNAGVDLKSLQYLMGHSDANTTLNTYCHSSYDTAKDSFDKAMRSLAV